MRHPGPTLEKKKSRKSQADLPGRSGNQEVEMNGTISLVAKLKEEAKAARDFDDFPAAIAALSRAIEILTRELGGVVTLPESEREARRLEIERELADFYGMKGGLHRREAMGSSGSERRNPSWLSESGPSRLIAIRANPQSLNRSMAPSVSSGVALGVTVVRSPKRTLFSINGSRSGRFKGSPPVKTISGSPKERTSSSKRKPSSVDSSNGLRLSIAQARQ